MKRFLSLAVAVTMTSSCYADGLLSVPASATPAIQTQAPSAAAAEPVQAVVIQAVGPAITEDQAIDMIRVTYMPVPLRSKLKKRYGAYKVTVHSDYPGTLRMVSANIGNGFPGTAAFTSVETSKNLMWWGMLGGLAGLVVIGLPILGIVSASNGKAEKESVPYPNQIPLRDIHKGESFSFNALVLNGQQPELNIALKDTKSEFTFSKNK